MNFRRLVLFVLLLLSPGFVHAKLFLLLDERLKKSRVEQTIYKFVPLTSAAEVELNYVQGFLKDQSATAFALKLKADDRGLYIGADEWPQDQHLQELTRSRAWFDTLGKIAFLVGNNAPDYAPMPRGLFARRDLWKKYAEYAHLKHEGFFASHYLDTAQNELKSGDWENFTCVHESGRELKPGKHSPLRVQKKNFQLSFRSLKQLDFLGGLTCTNTPKADAILEIHTAKTDVALEAVPGRFSLWNEAQPLSVSVTSSRQISAPLSLQIVPEVNETQTEFFFQGERITCTSGHCRKKDARLLLPQFKNFTEHFDLAIRASGESYFRGTLRLMAGEIEIARTQVRFTPQSWVAETGYALKNPSEYQSAFLLVLLMIGAAIGSVALLWRAFQKLARRLAERAKHELPCQSSAATVIERGVSYRMTAGENPFGCELYAFGGIVVLCAEGESVAIRHGGLAEQRFPLEGFCYTLPDGYVLEIRKSPEGGLLLSAYLVDLAPARR